MIKFINNNVLRTIMLYEIYGISYRVISHILRGNTCKIHVKIKVPTESGVVNTSKSNTEEAEAGE